MDLAEGVSIIISTYNGSHLLNDTLFHITRQKISIPCELIIVDNASTDGTKNFVTTWWKNNEPSNIDLVLLSESKPGKVFAQKKGIKKAKYKYIITCDDDNWLCENYVQTAFEVMESKKSIGALGGAGEAVFEGGEEPIWFNSYSRFFASCKQGQQSGDITNEKGCVYGAGMVLRKSYYELLESTGFVSIYTSRQGKNLMSGSEDTEICYALRILGYKIYYDERLKFKHFIEKKRQSKFYLWNLLSSQAKMVVIGNVYKDVINNDIKNKYTFYVITGTRIFSKKTIKNIIYYVINNNNSRSLSKYYFISIYNVFKSYSYYQDGVVKLTKWIKILNK